MDLYMGQTRRPPIKNFFYRKLFGRQVRVDPSALVVVVRGQRAVVVDLDSPIVGAILDVVPCLLLVVRRAMTCLPWAVRVLLERLHNLENFLIIFFQIINPWFNYKGDKIFNRGKFFTASPNNVIDTRFRFAWDFPRVYRNHGGRNHRVITGAPFRILDGKVPRCVYMVLRGIGLFRAPTVS